MGTDCKSAAFQLRWFESTRAHQKRKIRTCFRLEKGSDFSFSSGTTMKAPVDGTKCIQRRNTNGFNIYVDFCAKYCIILVDDKFNSGGYHL